MYVAIVIVVLGICYLGWVAFASWYETKHAQRVEMFICDMHGMLPASAVMNLDTYMGTDYKMCPICYKKKFHPNNGT